MKSPTISPLGIFGVIEENQENYFQDLQKKYSDFSKDETTKDTFNHLSLVINKAVPRRVINSYLNVIEELKKYLPLKLLITSVVVKDENTIALTFNSEETKKIREIISATIPDGIIVSNYMKVVRHVPSEEQAAVVKELKNLKELIINVFILVAEKLDKEHII
ncbi:MAG: hypothetical protein ABIO02_04410 [Patescibacteria group bacterium]